METPQEVEVWYVLPALRRQLAVCLKKEGMRQKDIAITLNLTEPAVSQYLKKKRGEDIKFDTELKKQIFLSAKALVKDKTKARHEIQKLMRKINDGRFLCNVCHDHANTPKDCT